MTKGPVSLKVLKNKGQSASDFEVIRVGSQWYNNRNVRMCFHLVLGAPKFEFQPIEFLEKFATNFHRLTE